VRFRVILAVAAIAAAVVPSTASSRSSSQILRVVDVGKGSGEAWLYLPAEAVPSCAVVYLHGAGDLTPGRYQAWLDYLTIGRHCAVVFPRYQRTPASPAFSGESLRGLRAGAAAGFAYLRSARFGLYDEPAPKRLPVVAAGFGEGGVLAMYYAANAGRWGLRIPAAVDSVFPAGGRVGAPPLVSMPRSTHVLIQVGDRDRVGGRPSGNYLWRYLASHPAGRKRLQVVRSTADLVAVHTAPLQYTAAAQDAFWSPLDALIDAAGG
jgi:poly(3-hydroxybutyrate) depolymerase